MLQQVLRDMYIDPELLAGLKEKEKQTLFCCMREEQVRRWRLWDQKESEAINNQPIRSKRTGKSVQWALDSTGEPRVDIIECKYEEADYSDSESSNHSNKQCEHKELRLSIEGARCLNLSSNDSVKKVPKYVDVTSNNKIPTSASVIINFNEKRGALQELSLNKVPKVARQVAEWEKRTTKEEFKLPAIGKTVDVESNNKIEHTNEVELQQERLWREQQKKAKEVEIRIRTIARLAREEHRRSLIENNDENFQSLLITENAWCKNINKLVNKEVLLEWFCTKEIPKMAVSDNNNSIARWFYGFISWQEAESLLDDEEIGTFLVRISEHILGYALSYKDVIDVKHYLIDVANGFYKIHGTDHISHNTLGELVSYYKNKPLTSNMDDVLKYPCCKERDLSYLFERSEC